MHLAVLALPDSWYFRDLHRAAGSDHRISPVTFSQLRSHLVGGRQEIFSDDCDLGNVDAVLVRTMPPGSLERVVFRMDLLARLEAARLGDHLLGRRRHFGDHGPGRARRLSVEERLGEG